MSNGKKKAVRRFAYFAAAVIALVVILNIKVTTKQGKYDEVRTKRIPLYLKSLGFLYRHLEYKQLVSEIAGANMPDEEKTLAIFDWTHKNILKAPKGIPVVDDHILNIIIRGYGSSDQSNDVFCNLCNYAGIEATWFMMKERNSTRTMAVSFVKLDGKWRFFDSYTSLYFKDKNGEIACLEDLVRDPGIIIEGTKGVTINDIPYVNFMDGLKEIVKIDNRRFRLQTPLGRLADAFKGGARQ